ncbi:MAG: glycosyl hydrolase family 28-related protein [Planctomycetota bacterium]
MNVEDFGADGSDDVDDTQAIQAAIEHALLDSNPYGAPRFVYLPDGTYLISGPVESRVAVERVPERRRELGSGWSSGLNLIGQSKAGVVLQLVDKANGYGNPGEPEAVIRTGSEIERPNPSGSGNRAFRHYIRNLTIDTGRGNPGAVGIDYLVNNRGAITDVTIRSGDGAGYAGVMMERAWPGPGLLTDVTIEGFDYGVTCFQSQYSMTLRDVTLSGQRQAGLLNRSNQLVVHRLVSHNNVPALVSERAGSHIVLLDADLLGGSPGQPAVAFEGNAFLRDVRYDGYRQPIDDRRDRAKAKASRTEDQRGHIELFVSDEIDMDGREAAGPLNLPLPHAPSFHEPDVSKWASVTEFGATVTPNWGQPGLKDDDGPGIQAAIDSGAEVVYLPNGIYMIDTPIVVRGKVRLIIGMGAMIQSRDYERPLIIDGDGQSVELQHVRLQNIPVLHRGGRDFVARYADLMSGYEALGNRAGDLFVEDAMCPRIKLSPGQHAVLHQLNSEFKYRPFIDNQGATAVVVGFKTEGNNTAIVTRSGGQTELLGGYFFREVRWGGPKFSPLFQTRGDSRMSASYVQHGMNYPQQAEADRRSVKRFFQYIQDEDRAHGRGVGLLTIGTAEESKGYER